jgi:hypothetical protein
MVLLVFVPAFPQSVSALQLNGGYLLTDNSRPQGNPGNPAFDPLAENVSRTAAFIAAAGGQNYTFSYVFNEGGAGWSEAILVYDHYGNQLVNVCGSLQKALADELYVGFNTSLPLGELTNMSNPSTALNSTAPTIIHMPGRDITTCSPLTSIGGQPTYHDTSSALFLLMGVGVTYLPNWGLVLKL